MTKITLLHSGGDRSENRSLTTAIANNQTNKQTWVRLSSHWEDSGIVNHREVIQSMFIIRYNGGGCDIVSVDMNLKIVLSSTIHSLIHNVGLVRDHIIGSNVNWP